MHKANFNIFVEFFWLYIFCGCFNGNKIKLSEISHFSRYITHQIILSYCTIISFLCCITKSLYQNKFFKLVILKILCSCKFVLHMLLFVILVVSRWQILLNRDDNCHKKIIYCFVIKGKIELIELFELLIIWIQYFKSTLGILGFSAIL